MENEEMKKKIISLLDKISVEKDDDKLFNLVYELRKLKQEGIKEIELEVFRRVFLNELGRDKYIEVEKKIANITITQYDKWKKIKNGK